MEHQANAFKAAMAQPAFTAAAHPDEYAKIQAFLATASHAILHNACEAAFMFASDLTGSAIYGAPQTAYDSDSLYRAGILSRYEDLTTPDDVGGRYFMSPAMRRGILALIVLTEDGQEILLRTFLKALHVCIFVDQPPLTPEGVLITPQRERMLVRCLNLWYRYNLYVVDAVPWPADKRAASYVDRVRGLRRLSRYFVECTWYLLGTSRHMNAMHMVGEALKAASSPYMRTWSSGIAAEEQAWLFGYLDYSVAVVHTFSMQKVEPNSTSEAYRRFRLEWAARLEQPVVGTLEERMWSAVKRGFENLFANTPNLLKERISQDMPARDDLEKLGMLAWVDGRWHHRLASFTVGSW